MTPYSTLHPVQQAIRWYRIRVIAHRLRKFGFEHGINHLSSEDLRALATMMPEHQSAVLLEEADSKDGNPCKVTP